MQYGINLLLWADTLTDEVAPVLDEMKAIGACAAIRAPVNPRPCAAALAGR